MKKAFLGLTLALITFCMQAQLYIGSDVNSLVIKNGETLNYDGLSLTPSADLTLTNTTLTKTDAKSISPAPSWNYISRYYTFSNTTSVFNGTIRLSYSGAGLNGLTAGNLRLFTKNSTTWTGGFGNDVGTGGGSHVEVNGISSTGLNTLTLASSGTSLPLNWLRFTAVKKGNTAALNWSTANEINTRDFVVQYSSGGIGWENLGIVKATGNTINRSEYAFTHVTPTPGFNYYRLMQRDLDGRFSYSSVVSVQLNKEDIKLKVFPNPVRDGYLNVLMKEATQISIVDATGRSLLSKWINAGIQPIDVSSFANGIYFIKTNTESITITIKR